MIPLNKCKHRFLYLVEARNFSYGVFSKEERGFIGIRTKFEDSYLFTEYHWDTGPPYGTSKPIRVIGKAPDGLAITERLIEQKNGNIVNVVDNEELFEWIQEAVIDAEKNIV